MGIWSEPLFVEPSGLKLNKSLLPAETVDRLECHGMFDEGEGGSDSDVAEEVGEMDVYFAQIYDTSKIWGYLDYELVQHWTILAKELCRFNSIENVKFHLYCLDQEFPYILEYNAKTKKLLAHTGHRCHAAFFDFDFDFDAAKDPEEEAMCIFNPEKYRKVIETVPSHMEMFDCQPIGCKIPPDSILSRDPYTALALLSGRRPC